MKQDLKKYIGYWINRVRMNLHNAFEQRLERYDITIAQWCVLMTVYAHKQSTIGELTTYIDVDKASISRVVERLVQKGLMTHLEGKDRRSGKVELTKQGKDLVPTLIEEADENEQFFFWDLSTAEMKQLQHLLRKVLMKTPSTALDGWIKKGI